MPSPLGLDLYQTFQGITDKKVVRAKNFTPKKHLYTIHGTMSGHNDSEFAINMEAWPLNNLRGRRWHSSQIWDELPAGGSRLLLSCLEDIEQWILSWGTHATVLRPQLLADRVRKIAEDLSKRYAQPPPPTK